MTRRQFFANLFIAIPLLLSGKIVPSLWASFAKTTAGRLAMESVNAFTRRMMREEGMWAKIMPPRPLGNDIL